MSSTGLHATVIVCTYNRARHLKRMLETLAANTVNPPHTWDVIVVDNNSSDDTRRVVNDAKAMFPCTLTYVFESRQGKSHALNTAIAQASGRLLAFTDDDVEIDLGWIQGFLAAAETSSAIGFGGRIIADWNGPPPSWYSQADGQRLMDAIVQFDFGEREQDLTRPPYGANMAFRREAFDRFGMFRVDLGPNGDGRVLGEDTEFCRRLLATGERIAYVPAAALRHPVEPHRATKRYFEDWYFNYGRATVRTGQTRTKGVMIFGVPRHLLRTLATDVLRWWTSVRANRRFYHKLHSLWTLGAMLEIRRARSSGTVVQTPPIQP